MTQLPSVSELMIKSSKDSSPTSSLPLPADTKPVSAPRSPSTIPRISSSSSFSNKLNYSSSRANLPPPAPIRRLTEPSIMYNQTPQAPAHIALLASPHPPVNYQLNQRMSTSSSIDPLTREPSTTTYSTINSSPSMKTQAVASASNLPPAPQYPHPSHSQGTLPTSGASYPYHEFPQSLPQPPQAPHAPGPHDMNPPPGYPYYYPVAPVYQQGPQGEVLHHQHVQQPYMYQVPPGATPAGAPGTGYYHPGMPPRMMSQTMDNGLSMVGMQMAPGMYEENNALINKRRIIKRRTRTGCLTCRKRRIKCDERKPTCFNCERSKKVCLGYEKLNGLGNKKRRDTSLDLLQDGEDDDNDHDHDQALLPLQEQEEAAQASKDQNGTGDHSGASPTDSKVSVHNLIK
ncbi:uncharacterized protein CANTADRAFT_23893 [Suhomyces tanzawaensis NRRL Y-17324]|uniref:Zn(2)-C6 fungal-type domain-containing protein n=1 Tax=Suhomyces tanzawaensis NRRL Y-17324 TaxID=984487 RepID=A0A1E4SC33_9ASCO|nr:uncharacterized protein CANTADRAFT_23893 [Suhomyces tanzawaensis NRRL Y-17324]ODV77061.1 hypothetical protein CANTADRAFT_23893 [Suhomyces tanzawaensis NRRL Y-17324]